MVKKNKKKSNIVKAQSNNQAVLRFVVSPKAQKMLSCFFEHTKQDENIFADKQIPAKDVIAYCGINPQNAYKELKDILSSIATAKIEYENNEDYAYINLFQYVGDITRNEEFVRYKYNDTIITELPKLLKEIEEPYLSSFPKLLMLSKPKEK